jgi:hypothetical protein
MKLGFPIVAAAIIALAAPAAPAAAAPKADRPGATKSNAVSFKSPLVFYVAKGEPDACGQGCSEWIAAEGEFDPGSPQRLRSLLTRLGKRKLPIFFNSPGGLRQEAMSIGRLLRERQMTAGVSETIPADCAAPAAPACQALKRSGQELTSELRNVSGCSSACVYALIGAKVRQVPPGARLGVHTGKAVARAPDGRITVASAGAASWRAKAATEDLHRRYLREMRIDVRLLDVIAKVPFEKSHYLSRDEIAGFGIDVRESHEARWTAMELLPQQLWAMKFFIAARGEDHKELRTSFVQIACAGAQRAKIGLFRGVGSDDVGAKRTVRLAIGDRSVLLAGSGSAFKMESFETGASFSLWTAYAPFELLDAAAARDSVEIVESDATNTTPRITKLSTAGLAQAIAALHRRCDGKQDCFSSGSGTAGSPSCDVPFTGGRGAQAR